MEAAEYTRSGRFASRRDRRLRPDATSKPIVRNGVTIDTDRHQVKIDGKTTPFTATEFRLLHFFASNPGRTFKRDQLLSRVIGESSGVDKGLRAV